MRQLPLRVVDRFRPTLQGDALVGKTVQVKRDGGVEWRDAEVLSTASATHEARYSDDGEQHKEDLAPAGYGTAWRLKAEPLSPAAATGGRARAPAARARDDGGAGGARRRPRPLPRRCTRSRASASSGGG